MLEKTTQIGIQTIGPFETMVSHIGMISVVGEQLRIRHLTEAFFAVCEDDSLKMISYQTYTNEMLNQLVESQERARRGNRV